MILIFISRTLNISKICNIPQNIYQTDEYHLIKRHMCKLIEILFVLVTNCTAVLIRPFCIVEEYAQQNFNSTYCSRIRRFSMKPVETVDAPLFPLPRLKVLMISMHRSDKNGNETKTYFPGII